jgi:phage nucleotide-binding protein
MPELHSSFGYSAVSTFEQCQYRYKLQYIDGLKTIPTDDPTNALVIGTALHKAIETDIDTAIQEYFNSYTVITDQHIDEEIKLRYLIPKVKEILPDGIHEVQVIDRNFMGTLDLLVPVGKNEFDLYDFKYSNNWMRYMDSRQLHLYKYYFEKCGVQKIRNMYFLFVPKVQIRQKKTETLFEFRQRLLKELDKVEPTIRPVQYNPQKVIDHLEITQVIPQMTEYSKNPTRLCDWCDYKKYCQEGDLQDMLPSTSRVAVNATNYKKMWIYGQPFSGKTTVCDGAPTPLNLNTDGNVKTVTMARLPIKDTMDGRQKKLAWEIFKAAIDDLEAGSDFETIVVDLLEDTYESCRLFMYKQMGITHESDDSFRAWDKVRTEFLSTFRRLLNLPYNVILISHEDMSKDITKRSGDKITAIRPNIQDKIANKIAGMVDIVCRVLVEDDGRYLSFKSDAVVFGGGRFSGHGKNTIPLSWDAIEDFYATVGGQNRTETVEVPSAVEEPTRAERQPRSRKTEPQTVTEPEEDEVMEQLRMALENAEDKSVTVGTEPYGELVPQTVDAEPTEEPKRRTRRTRN